MINTEKTFEQRKNEADERTKILKEWGDAREEREQIIYAQGLNGNLMVSAISGNNVEILSLLYDILERVATESDVDFITMMMGFLQIYNVKTAKQAKAEAVQSEPKQEEKTDTKDN